MTETHNIVGTVTDIQRTPYANNFDRTHITTICVTHRDGTMYNGIWSGIMPRVNVKDIVTFTAEVRKFSGLDELLFFKNARNAVIS